MVGWMGGEKGKQLDSDCGSGANFHSCFSRFFYFIGPIRKETGNREGKINVGSPGLKFYGWDGRNINRVDITQPVSGNIIQLGQRVGRESNRLSSNSVGSCVAAILSECVFVCVSPSFLL